MRTNDLCHERPAFSARAAADMRRNAYWAGFDAYCNGAPLDEMNGDEMRRGWWAALNAEAAAATGHDRQIGG